MIAFLDGLRQTGEAMRRLSADAQSLAEYTEVTKKHAAQNGYGEAESRMLALEHAFAHAWLDTGAIVYELTHDIAAMFAMTSPPLIDWERMPHDAFVVKVPRSLFPIDNVPVATDSWICVWATNNGNLALVVSDVDTTACTFLDYRDGGFDFESSGIRNGILCNRFIANTVAYVSRHRECVSPKGLTKNSKSIFTVRAPRDVIITKEFRDAAIAAAASNTLTSVRRALAHVVRGHWRNQAVGAALSERRLTWVRPHRRGDESLGRVVRRIESLHAKDES